MANLFLSITIWIAILIPIILVIVFSIKYKSWFKSSLIFILSAILGIILGYGIVKLCLVVDGDVTCTLLILIFYQLGIVFVILAIISAIIGGIFKLISKNKK